MKKVGVISLGCDKNRVDTENMLEYLSGRYELTQKIEDANVIIVNTCAFINSAREEAIDTIFEAKSYNPEKLIVTGCLPQKFISELFDDLTEVDAFLGTASYHKIADIIDKLYETNERINAVTTDVVGVVSEKRIVTTPYHYAYLKIAEGCDNHCTYCLIPSIRGKYVSREEDSLIREAKQLVSSGAREIILVAQDVTRYGEDKGQNKLVSLIQNLSKIDDLKWIRLMYLYPENVTDELINELKTNDKLVKYADIPMQHISNAVLKRMGRRTNGDYIKELITKLRREVPDIAIRSTFIVGFPGETEQQFEELCEFLKGYKLNMAGFFQYSREEGTAAFKLDCQLEENVKSDRQEMAYSVQKEVVALQNNSAIGKKMTVIYDGVDFEKDMFFGRSMSEAPDIDRKIYIKSKKPLEVGNFYDVTITKVDGYDLIGVIK